MPVGRELLKGHLPALVLAVLAEEPMHGYALCRRIRERCGDALKMGEGTLYPLLYRLEERGLVSSKWERDEFPRPRKVYRVTGRGKRYLKEQKTEWAVLFGVIRSIMGEEWALS
jgi:DNA-binding PadR family transcriptional regulator